MCRRYSRKARQASFSKTRERGRSVHLLQDLSISKIHMDTTRQAGIKTSYRTHDVDALKILGTVLLENGGILNRVLVRSGGPIDVARVRIPTGRWVRMIVCYLPISNHQVMREHAPHGLMETAPDTPLPAP